jgi:hypothetical protein
VNSSIGDPRVITVQKGRHVAGIAKEVLRERLIHLIKQRPVSRNPGLKIETPKSKQKGRKSVKENLPPTDPAVHYHISTETRNRVDIADFLDVNEDDPAVEVCLLFCL